MRCLLFKSAFTVSMFLLFATATGIQTAWSDEVLNVSEYQQCRAIKGKAERLLCYDTIADGGVFNQQQLQQVQRETFGAKRRESDISVDQLSVTIVRVQKGANGYHYFHTDSGEVWKQQNPGSYSTRAPFEAEIKSALMGSFFLVNENGRGERVTRVK